MAEFEFKAEIPQQKDSRVSRKNCQSVRRTPKDIEVDQSKKKDINKD